MLQERQKIVQLLDELLNYTLQTGPRKVTIEIENLDDRVQIVVEGADGQRSEAQLREDARCLHVAEREEMKDYYSGLVGEESFGPCNLRIVGMMVDGGRIESTDAGTRLTVWWAPE
jgi:hypothetical protein